MSEKIRATITFNAHKHHFRFLLEKIETWKYIEWKHVEPEILLIGENLLDFYTGHLTVDNIVSECIQYFSSREILEKTKFTKWLYPAEYRKITLGDSSEWVIKLGNDTEKYIHIHPAKKSPQTIRVRASTLKTVVTLLIQNVSISAQPNENLKLLNNIRTELLKLSPIKSLQQGKGILKLWELFGNNHSAILRLS